MSVNLSNVIASNIYSIVLGNQMSLIEIATPVKAEPLDLIERLVDAFLGSRDGNELCKRYVHSDFLSGLAYGAALYTLDAFSNLARVAFYGNTPDDMAEPVSIWANHPIAACVREKKAGYLRGDEYGLFAVPLLSNGIPNGCLALTLAPEVEQSPVPDEVLPMLSKVGAFFVESMISPVKTNGVTTDVADELTTRQINILGFMADGLTNAEIANLVLLSESTVRQETIRIYRALKVNSRIDAAAKGRALGLIKRANTR
jgi:DNA-binding CsgD family transcriptional regulator